MPEPSPSFDDLLRLGLTPGAPPAALKPAWRRAVSTLHPDRQGPHADRELAEVNAAFQRLQAFVDQHGRLPGRFEPAIRPVQVDRRSNPRWALTALALAAAVVVLWPQSRPAEIESPPSETTSPDRAPEIDGDVPVHAVIGAPSDHLRIGHDPADVERIAGPPMFRSAERWEYGPSEVRFDGGKVSGWYSSPLRPLPVDDMRGFTTGRGD